MASSSSSTATAANPPAYAHELHVARHAVRRAALLTARVFREKAKGAVDKDDKSPVTVGDFGAQAIITAALRRNFPDDEIVAEEEAGRLREDEGLREHVWRFVRDALRAAADGDGEEKDRGLGGDIAGVNVMLDLIDCGKSKGGRSGRIWTIDPIDGTKGFLRGGQYAVCLALMVDGDVKVGVLGCPNLPVDDAVRLTEDVGTNQSGGSTGSNKDADQDKNDDSRGVLFSAVLGHGATSRALSSSSSSSFSSSSSSSSDKPISMRPIHDLAEATFCESFEAAHFAHDDQALIAQRLAITRPSVRMDSQAKYGSIARGAGDIYLRLPVRASYQEKIWDHAAGDLIVREAGGCVTDIHGRCLDFGVGRTLANNKGVVAAPRGIHPTVLKAVQEVLKI